MKEKSRQKRLERKLKRQKDQEKANGVGVGTDLYDLDSSTYEYRKRGDKHSSNEVMLPYWHDYGPKRMYVHGIVTSKYFDLAIAAVIGVNVISMALEFYMMPQGLKYVLRALNYFFTAVFTMEAAFKLYALGLVKFLDERFAFYIFFNF